MSHIFHAIYAALIIHCIRRILSGKEMAFKLACRDYEKRVDDFLRKFYAEDPENLWIAPYIPFSPPEGYEESYEEDPEGIPF